MSSQVTKEHYNFKKYCEEERFVSYWHQLKEVLSLDTSSVLEIGVGDRVFGNYIKNNTSIIYTSADIAADLSPDVVGSVTNLPLSDCSFDTVCAFEVLEHLSFGQFIIALKEMSRVAKKNVIISLPHWGRHFSIKIRLPFFKKIYWQHKFNLWPIKHVFGGEHYWEIGKKGYSLGLIKRSINQAGLVILRDYISFDSPYHHFFVLNK